MDIIKYVSYDNLKRYHSNISQRLSKLDDLESIYAKISDVENNELVTSVALNDLNTRLNESNFVSLNDLKTINGESIIGSGDITITPAGYTDANVQAVDTGDIVDDINVSYATTAYVDELVGDINSVLENIING